MTPAWHRHGRRRILYDGDTPFAPDWFETAWNRGATLPPMPGRGPVALLRTGGVEYVCKHYRRGGLPGRWLRDTYLYTGERHVRSFAEWRLLAELRRRGLPVPAPCAAACTRHGPFYRADLITVRLAGTPLSRRLATAPLAEAGWRRIGVVLRRCHREGVWHADLNAHNLLLTDEDSEVFLVDFDRARLRPPLHGSLAANLSRLRRSLDKLAAAETAPCHFRPTDFNILLDAYHDPSAASSPRL